MGWGTDPMEIQGNTGGVGNPYTGYDIYRGEDEDRELVMSMQNPGSVDLSKANPALYAEMQRTNALRRQFDPFLQDAMDPNRYNARRDEAGQRMTTGMENYYARMGLSGSSAESSDLMEGHRQNNIAWEDRRLGEAMQIGGFMHGLDADYTKSLLVGQAGYGAFQGQMLDMYKAQMDSEAAAAAANAQLWGTVLGAAGTIGGAALGGPAGGAIGGQTGNIAGKGMAAGPNSNAAAAAAFRTSGPTGGAPYVDPYGSGSYASGYLNPYTYP
jgi:hypothetical protein